MTAPQGGQPPPPPSKSKQAAKKGGGFLKKIIIIPVVLFLLCCTPCGAIAFIGAFSGTSSIISLLMENECPEGGIASDNPKCNSGATGDLRAAIVRIALGQVGYKPATENCTKYVKTCAEWCAIFTQWVWREAGVNPVFETWYARTVAQEAIDSKGATGTFKPHKMGTRDGNPLPGDALIYGTPTPPGTPGHVGIVVKVHPDGLIDTVEGNTGNDQVSHYQKRDPATLSNGPGQPLSGYVAPPGGDASPAYGDNASFIEAVGAVAKADFATSKVPPSVTIAQAILESSWGKSGLSTKDKNFFGMKCFNNNPGTIAKGCANYPTQECGANGCYDTTASFRSYASMADSVKDHGKLLREAPRYAAAFNYPNDPDKFIREIHKGNYATDPNYTDKVIKIMREHNLYRFNS